MYVLFLLAFPQANIEMLSDELKAPKYNSYFICELGISVDPVAMWLLGELY